MTIPRGPGGHIDPVLGSARPVDVHRRPVSGPIALYPEPREPFVSAVRGAGGVIAPLSQGTRGMVWLAASGADELSDILRRHPGIGWVQLPWAGVDAFGSVLAEHADRDLPLFTSAKGAYSEPVAEAALALTLAVMRDFPEKVRAESWAPVKRGLSLYGRHVVIVGAGGIAVELLRLLAPFQVTTTIVRRSPGELVGATRTVTVDRLHDALAQADVVILAAAATEETAHLIGAPELAIMKPHAALVNIARGPLVDQDALVAALAAGHLIGAGLDVTSPEPLPDGHPLWTAPRTIVTSHTADTPEMVEPLLAARVAANVTAFLGDGAFVGLVDPALGY